MAEKKYQTLYYVSSNEDKNKEFQSLLNLADLRFSKREVLEIQTSHLEVLVERKAEDLRSSMPGLPFFVEHTGLEIKAWNKLPGGLTGEFLGKVKNRGICRMLQAWPNEREATAISIIGYSPPEGDIEIFKGEIMGTIADEPIGTKGFGWDPIFIPNGYSKTFAQMSADEKNAISMRRVSAGTFYLDILRKQFELNSQLEDPPSEEGRDDLDIVQLQQSILKGFNESELRDLCLRLRIDYEDIPGDTRKDKAREIIMYVNRRSRIEELLEQCRALRPKINWEIGRDSG